MFKLITTFISLSFLFFTPRIDNNLIYAQTQHSNIEDKLYYNEPYRDSIIAIESGSIVIMCKNGSGLRKLKDIQTSFVTWSPNKWKIIFSSGLVLYSMDYDGKNIQKISVQDFPIRYAVASPDGNKIACIIEDTTDKSSKPPNGWIKLMNADGSNDIFLTSSLSNPGRVTWTPDSKEIIFNQSYKFDKSGIYKISVLGCEISQLYKDSTGSCSDPTLSKDGNLLAFSLFNGIAGKIMIRNMKDGLISQLTAGDSYDEQPSWSVDGKSIVYESSLKNLSFGWSGLLLYTISIDGTDNLKINPVWHQPHSPSWQ
jgi:Tol biopolymer transport system component